MNIKYRTKNVGCATGSALILAVVLTSLLAIIGVMFLLSSRVDLVGTSSIADSKDLGSAVDSVITQISEGLAFDVPGDPCSPQEYYDYPDANNPWLASLEPNGNGLWPHISDVNNQLGGFAYDLIPAIIPDYQPTVLVNNPADADGDGVSDSAWVKVPNMTSNKGKPIYAAIRIIDNGGMLNVNTGYKFDPNSSVGSSQLDINLAALSLRGANGTLDTAAAKLDTWRCGTAPSSLYELNVVWQYANPVGAYTPFDISDELKLRNRYILNYNLMTSRIEELWSNVFDIGLKTPAQSISDPCNWFWRANNLSSNPEVYDYRHIATIQNLDRIIDPNGDKMFNINSASSADINTVYNAIRAALDPNISNAVAAQITANLIDYRDNDSNVTVVPEPNGIPHFGFETPCIYISEIAESIVHSGTPPYDMNTKSYAIELHKPYWEDPYPSTDPCNDWQLLIGGVNTVPIVWSGSNRFHVINLTEIGGVQINPEFNDVNGPNDINKPSDPCAQPSPYIAFTRGTLIELRRRVPDFNFITVDRVVVPEPNATIGWLIPVESNSTGEKVFSYQRDINQPIRRLWGFGGLPTIGGLNNYSAYPDVNVIQAHPANKPFTNVGEFGQLFYRPTYDYGGDGPWPGILEGDIRINLADPTYQYQQIFKYLTVMDPNEPRYGGHPADETRIKGRININTAPWFVIAQLPWVSYHTPNYDLARAIVNYRDTYGPFKSIGELMRVGIANGDPNKFNRMDFYAQDPCAFPLMTPPDGGSDYLERQDIIFARISNLVTVRSDVFTAYILVRIGADGPQKRVVAILDRSGVTPAGGKVKVIAIQQVPDPR